MPPLPRKRREKTVKARVSDELKEKVLALAAMKADDENESLVLREALTWYTERPEIKALIEEGRRRLAALEKEHREREKGGAHGGHHGPAGSGKGGGGAMG